MTDIAFVVIGRNEGERLKRCLLSLQRVSHTVIYVDSGSTDGSREFAACLGVEVLELDTSSGFTMARARNAGWRRVMEIAPDTKFVHFIDGDCELIDGWLSAALNFLEIHPDVAVVCGRRRELYPEHSIYNRLIDIEWNTPVGETISAGGDALMRLEILISVGGFDDDLIAGEEPELCGRIRANGWQIFRLDCDMTWHDADLLHFAQWWKRYVRGGYGASDVAFRMTQSGFSGRNVLFASEVRSARLWTMGTILLLSFSFVVALLACHPWIFLVMAVALLLLLWTLQVLRIAISLRQRAGGMGIALVYALFLMLAKWPQGVGLWKYAADRRSGRTAKLIEYKK